MIPHLRIEMWGTRLVACASGEKHIDDEDCDQNQSPDDDGSGRNPRMRFRERDREEGYVPRSDGDRDWVRAFVLEE